MSAVIVERRGAVTIITLNNPEQYNALNDQRMKAIDQALDEAISDESSRCILLTGAGKGFCSGAQFGGDVFATGAAIGDSMREHVSPIVEKMRTGRLPVVVAVNGPAAGAGVGFALAGDIVIAARSAKFLLSFVNLGAVLDGGTSLLVQRSVGAARGRAMAMLGEALPAQTAAEWGLIWKCVDDELLMAEAMSVAERLANSPPIAIELIKRQLELGWSATIEAVLDDEASRQTTAFVSDDLQEGARAFVEKRRPVFVGR